MSSLLPPHVHYTTGISPSVSFYCTSLSSVFSPYLFFIYFFWHRHYPYYFLIHTCIFLIICHPPPPFPFFIPHHHYSLFSSPNIFCPCHHSSCLTPLLAVFDVISLLFIQLWSSSSSSSTAYVLLLLLLLFVILPLLLSVLTWLCRFLVFSSTSSSS